MKIFLIAKEELLELIATPLAWIILGSLLFVHSCYGGYWGLEKEPSSYESVEWIFYVASGVVMVLGLLIGMRLFAEEKALGSIELLLSSPLYEVEIVLGKFLGAFFFLGIYLLFSLPVVLSVYFLASPPLSLLIPGYLGLLLLGSSVISMQMFYSSLFSSQLLVALLGGFQLVVFLLMGFFSPYIGEPLKSFLKELSFYIHFMNFEKGVIDMKDVAFYISFSVFFLFLTTLSLQGRKWKL